MREAAGCSNCPLWYDHRITFTRRLQPRTRFRLVLSVTMHNLRYLRDRFVVQDLPRRDRTSVRR